MGLKDDLIEAKAQAALASGANPDDIDTSVGSATAVEAELMKEAIISFLTEADFTVTQLKAPVTVESLKTPDQLVNIRLETLLGDKGPILKTIRKLGALIPGASEIIDGLVDELETAIEKAVTPLLEGGASVVGLDLDKNAGGLEAGGYVHIGEDPDSKNSFNVEDEGGQRNFTTVKLIREDVEDLL